MTSQLEEKIAHYQQWREEMITGIEFYKSWVDAHGNADIHQSMRIYDLIESLRNDRMTLAFLAEYSRGKTELINAMFFSQFKQRLLPSNVGRTTMCPTEIFYDPSEEPYLRLLPIVTRRRQESVSALKRQSVEWIKIKLNMESQQDMITAMKHLAEVKAVSVDEAKSLGLWEEGNQDANPPLLKESGEVEIPAWRHAMISYPHPLLKNGLVVLDTPGLNALGIEPELTLSIIPNAHAVLFLLAMDTGVTKSDLEVWQKHVQPAATRRIAVLNKVDLMWDELKTESEVKIDIDRQVQSTGALLALPSTHVLAISAQKALLARVRGDDMLLEKSGLRRLEALLAEEIIPDKREIMRSAVQREIGTLVDASRGTVQSQLNTIAVELSQLTEIAGKNRNLAQAMVARLDTERTTYKASVQSFDTAYATVMAQGARLLKQLDAAALNEILNKDRKFIESSWTTAALWKNMQLLFQHFLSVSKRMLKFANNIKELIDLTYNNFNEKFGFAKLSPPALNLERHTLTMTGLQEMARQFCHDPVNLAKYKDFVVSEFYESLVAEARQIFEITRMDAENWLKSALSPLNRQIKAHEQVLTKRLENFKKIRDNIHSVEERMEDLEKQNVVLTQQNKVLAGIRTNLEG